MTFNPFSGIINSDFKNLHANAITELVTGCAVPCTLVYGQTLFTDCPNCLLNVVGNKSSNRYQAGGPTPFVGICPVCNGAGKIPTEQTASIDLAIIYDYREWINIGIEIGSPLGYVQSLSLLKTLDDLKEAKELIVDTNISKYVNQRFERVGEPQPCGFGQATIVVTMWKRIES